MNKELFKKLSDKYTLNEMGYFYSNGKQFLSINGNNTQIRIPVAEKELIQSKSNIVFIHNHPVEDWTLSSLDISAMLQLNIKRFIAISNKKTYILETKEDILEKEKQYLYIRLSEIIATALKVTNNYDGSRNEFIVREFVKLSNKLKYSTIDNDKVNPESLVIL
jgi:hypothetical protein